MRSGGNPAPHIGIGGIALKTIAVTVCGQEYHLCYNAAAMLELQDKYGDDLYDAITEHTAAGLAGLCDVAATLSEQGELVRRYMGYDKGAVITAETLHVMLSPTELLTLRDRVLRAYMAGFGREINEDEEADLGLAEMQKKTD